MAKRPNVHSVYLPAEYYVAISKVQAELEIGKSAAILLELGKGLHVDGYLDEEIWDLFRKNYTKPLLEIVKGTRRKKNEESKLKERCQWAAYSADKCRRKAFVKLKKGDDFAYSCPQHVNGFKRAGYEAVQSS